ncbi:hypothetical protein QA639_09280 [Bradyrhizobium pachyrhizi]|uniref:hypothetical protein n=1 Tax=Bradyrhizobium TaxID=374 RepID=UPI0024B26E01|nr:MULTISPECIES: hypothetical protein [Bradyrhizobium]WFU57683.1 hypothetical protein QA639_09280 [Bradyrhizobium pachyrhizi]WOH83229.1 hypothetical protein RX327_08840 [Bradyrhizobium sp. BEA-2-5]
MLGPSWIAEPLSAEKQRSSFRLKKYRMKIACPVRQIITPVAVSEVTRVNHPNIFGEVSGQK